MKEHILIVEDEQSTIDLLHYNLSQKGYSVLVARNGRQGLDMLRQVVPDLMLLDVMMPELDGWEVCRTVRAMPQARELPVIMLSALGDEESRIKGLGLGVDDYLAKPFSVKELMIKIARHLERKRFRDSSLTYLVHELRNAVTAIGGFSSLALRKDGTLPYYRNIRSSALHIQNLLNDTALLSKLESGHGLPLSSIEIDSAVSEIPEMFEVPARDKEIELVVMDRGKGPVLANDTGLRQVLINLVSNAVKYSRRGGAVRIRIEGTAQATDISITDEGPGIAPHELPMIFDKFYRASGSEKVKGAGLGLYIVKLLTAAMGGTVSAVSTPGQGSVFTVSLPRSPGPGLHASLLPAAEVRSERGNGHVFT